jgi:hypothetical protein
LVAAIIAVSILGGRAFFATAPARAPAAIVPQEVPAAPAAPAAAAPSGEQPAGASTSTLAPVAPDTQSAPAGSATAAVASAAPSSAAPAPATSMLNGKPLPPLAEGMTRVIVTISPPPVGRSPVVIDLAPGERRAYEVGSPGWATRKLVVDGTKPEIFIGLKPEEP